MHVFVRNHQKFWTVSLLYLQNKFSGKLRPFSQRTEVPLFLVSGQLPSEENCSPRLGLGFRSRLGLVLGLGVRLGSVLGLRGNFPRGTMVQELFFVASTVIENATLPHATVLCQDNQNRIVQNEPITENRVLSCFYFKKKIIMILKFSFNIRTSYKQLI